MSSTEETSCFVNVSASGRRYSSALSVGSGAYSPPKAGMFYIFIYLRLIQIQI